MYLIIFLPSLLNQYLRGDTIGHVRFLTYGVPGSFDLSYEEFTKLRVMPNHKLNVVDAGF